MPIEDLITIWGGMLFAVLLGVLIGMTIERSRRRLIEIRRAGLSVADPYGAGTQEILVAKPTFQQIYLGSFSLSDGTNEARVPGVSLQVRAGTEKELGLRVMP